MKNRQRPYRREGLGLLLGICLLLCLPNPVSAQSPYSLSPTLDVSLTLGGAGLGAWGFLREKRMPSLTMAELNALDQGEVNPFDRFATRLFSERADFASDLTAITGVLLPFSMLAREESRKDIKTLGLMFLEGALWTEAFTSISKSGFQRIRPYAYNSLAPLSLRSRPDTRASFISGHTSFTAFGSFFAAQLFHDYFPESKWQPAVWLGAASLSAATAYLRVRAGRHYPTDVIAGYAVGAAVGIIIPRLHYRKDGNYLTLVPTGNGLALTCKF